MEAKGRSGGRRPARERMLDAGVRRGRTRRAAAGALSGAFKYSCAHRATGPARGVHTRGRAYVARVMHGRVCVRARGRTQTACYQRIGSQAKRLCMKFCVHYKCARSPRRRKGEECAACFERRPRERERKRRRRDDGTTGERKREGRRRREERQIEPRLTRVRLGMVRWLVGRGSNLP